MQNYRDVVINILTQLGSATQHQIYALAKDTGASEWTNRSIYSQLLWDKVINKRSGNKKQGVKDMYYLSPSQLRKMGYNQYLVDINTQYDFVKNLECVDKVIEYREWLANEFRLALPHDYILGQHIFTNYSSITKLHNDFGVDVDVVVDYTDTSGIRWIRLFVYLGDNFNIEKDRFLKINKEIMRVKKESNGEVKIKIDVGGIEKNRWKQDMYDRIKTAIV